MTNAAHGLEAPKLLNRRHSARSRRIGVVSYGVIALALATGAAHAQVVVTHGNPYGADQEQGAAGAAGKDNQGRPNCGTGPGAPGNAGPNRPDGNFTYAPNPATTYNGDVVIIGSNGGSGGNGGNDPFNGGCVYNGGDGGAGGNGGNVSITVNPGANAPAGGYMVGNTGIIGYADGGNGGDGGFATYKTFDGGNGGVGGNGGSVTLVNNAALDIVGGPTAFGIVAQATGGQGGAGGIAYNGNSGSLGGSGVAGGSGGNIFITNNAFITTNGGMGIVAQTIGGFGGDAGTNAYGFGGGGGFGGNGGTVGITNSGAITIGSASWSDCSTSGQGGCNPTTVGAIAAQSVGGGGGNAGAAAGLHALGASGGFAGNGGNVSVTNLNSLSIYGSSSIGVFAQSVGGGGGEGGLATASGHKSVAIGGSGGGGGNGNGGAVALVNTGTICTGNACLPGQSAIANNENSAGGAFGLFAQSIGGGGGTGGYAKATSKTIFGGSAHATGGSGGSGGLVTILNSGSIHTVELSSADIFAQSVGGGGGNAGGALAMATAFFGDSTSIAHGGSGGGGGNGGTIAVNCSAFSVLSRNTAACNGIGTMPGPASGAQLSTAGFSSAGIFAQSVGGGGGSGGYAVALSAGFFGSFSMALGGSGGNGGQGGAVYAGTGGVSITTQGMDSQGIIAQSIGGGGGQGGSAIDASLAVNAAIALGIGGTGGSGGSGSAVTVENEGGAITTSGAYSQGLMAQSIGGGGGAGGSSISFAAGFDDAAVSLAVGGRGGGGGQGAAVTVFNEAGQADEVAGFAPYGSGTITTNGYGSSAILAQSIGGGGGNGGYTIAGSISLGAGSANSIGGPGGNGGFGGTVSVQNSGALITTGGGAAALQAQSIGGGGGNGGFAVAGSYGGILSASIGVGGSGGNGGTASAVVVANTANITANAVGSGDAGGILAQSIGGSGGSGAFAIAGALSDTASASLSVGGNGGNGGTASAVTVSQSGSTTVTGDLSSGIVAQSLGGHGGTGGFAVAGGYSGGLGLSAAIGGDGGHGGTAGTVSVSLANAGQSVSTAGGQSDGIVAQSIGGSGGNGGWAFSAAINGLASVDISLGGSGGAGGSAGSADVDTAQAVTTDGLLSAGILAQSIGGNGGSGGFSAALAGSTIAAPAIAVGGYGGNGSTANTVSVTADGLITTEADDSTGIIAQSIGGSGGNGGSAFSGALATGIPDFKLSIGAAGATGGTGGIGQAANTVTVNSIGGIKTEGLDSIGIIAQSIGGGGGNGGNAAAFSVSGGGGNSKNTSVSASVAIGGAGAAGGNANTVNVMQSGNLTTGAPVTPGTAGSGDQSIGILAQSIGGSGGNGGSAYTNAISGTASVAVSVGGGGGAGGNGGMVLVNFNPYEYTASYTDLIKAFGTNADAAIQHYISNGIVEGRIANGFNVEQYLANYSDLQAAFGDNTSAAAYHFLTNGFNEGRTDQPLAGVAAVPNLIDGSITTYGNEASAVYAQSIGGGGGNGGWSEADASSNKYAVSVAVGGFGGDGGSGSTVLVVEDNGTLTTHGAQSTGIFAQSVGGGGGDGGAASASSTGQQGGAITGGAASYSGSGFAQQTNTGGVVSMAAQMATSGSGSDSDEDDNGAAGSLTIGGAGGAGGSGGQVAVETSDVITTSGALSDGVFAQSVGGGGGNGGSSTANASGGNYSGAISLGGTGGVGGNGSNVEVASRNAIATSGVESVGIFAQSVGGGGGNGGSDSSTSSGVAVGLSLGGTGGGGGNGATVEVANGDAVTTSGDQATAIFAQSIGGGGGTGGSADSNANGGSYTLSTSLGGSGAAGGIGGTVSLSNSGAILTHGSLAYGLFAQSVGGGGGSAAASSATAAGGGKANVGLTIGGSSGFGQGGGSVSITSNGTIGTTGAGAYAIIAQSVGGGGGIGAASRVSGSTGNDAATLNLGATGNINGNGGNVSVNYTAALSTTGGNAVALLAQSIGGGGGVASFDDQSSSSGGTANGRLGQVSGSDFAGAVTVTGSASISTSGAQSIGVLAQSVSGGGGLDSLAASPTTAFSGTMILGAASNANGQSSAVNVSLTGGTIATQGNFAYGVVAQSISGGGGVSEVVTTTAKLGGTPTSFARAVTVTNAEAISTTGLGAIGIVAQSIGGGGGLAIATGSANLGGATTSTGTNGDAVVVNSNASITTSGAEAVGILAQSVGGGGGAVLSTGRALSTSTTSGKAANAGAVTVNVNASITTSGAGAFGVVAQSISGGGGVVLDSTGPHQVLAGDGGTTGTVTVHVATGVSIVTKAAGTSAIYAHSTSDPVINIDAGASVTGGAGGYAMLLDSPVSQINNAGTLSTLGGGGDTVIESLSGTTSIANSGTLQGSIALAEGAANQLHNLAGGTIQAGSSIDLGSAGIFVNDGVLANAGGVGAVRINGAYSQSASGSLSVRVDQQTGASDSFSFSGTPILSGTLAIATLNDATVKPGTFTLADIVSADGGLNTSGLQLSTAKSAILNYALSNDGGKLSLVSTANFAPSGLSGAGAEVGAALGRIQAQGNSLLASRITAFLVGLDTTAKLEDAYKTIGAGGISIVPMQVLSTAERSVQSVTGRMDDWRIASPLSSQADPVTGLWLTSMASNTYGSGLSSHLDGVTVGIDRQLASRPILLGAAFSYTDAASTLNAPDAYGQGSQYALSLYGIGYMGKAYVSATGLVGAGLTHFTRSLDAVDIAMAGAAPIHSTTLGGSLEAGYTFDLGNTGGHIVPFAAIEPMSVHEATATETFSSSQEIEAAVLAAQDSAITFHGRTITAVPVSAGFQIDDRWQPGGDVAFAPQLRVAWVHDLDPDRDISRSFAVMPTFLIDRTTLPTPPDAAQVQLSGLWTAGKQWSLKASVDTEMSPAYSTMGGSLSGVWNAGRHWSVQALLNTQLSTLNGSTGGRMSVRYAW